MARLEEENRDFLAALEDAMEQYKLQVWPASHGGGRLPGGGENEPFPRMRDWSRWILAGWIGLRGRTNEQNSAGGMDVRWDARGSPGGMLESVTLIPR